VLFVINVLLAEPCVVYYQRVVGSVVCCLLPLCCWLSRVMFLLSVCFWLSCMLFVINVLLAKSCVVCY
jgi:hypothetical protein